MAQIPRVTQPIFASGASNNGQFGSAQLGTFNFTNDLATIMGLAAWAEGWVNAVIGSSKFPPLEEFQAIDYVLSTQLAYLFQSGIPEYDAGTTYYQYSVVRNPTTFQIYGSIYSGANVGHALSNTTYWKLLTDLSTSRIVLTAPTTYYVNQGTGNDSTGQGTLALPWKTINHAVGYIAQSIDLGGYVATIQFAAGTDTTGINILGSFVGEGQAGYVQIIGDNTTPDNCVISTTGTCIQVGRARIYIKGFKLTSSAGDGILALQGGQVFINGNMDFGACNQYQAISEDSGSIIQFVANYSISGGGIAHVWTASLGEIVFFPITATVTGTPAFSGAFAQANSNGSIYAVGVTWTGSATGTRYGATINGSISTGGVGANYFPGNSAGSTSTGGQYV